MAFPGEYLQLYQDLTSLNLDLGTWLATFMVMFHICALIKLEHRVLPMEDLRQQISGDELVDLDETVEQKVKRLLHLRDLRQSLTDKTIEYKNIKHVIASSLGLMLLALVLMMYAGLTLSFSSYYVLIYLAQIFVIVFLFNVFSS